MKPVKVLIMLAATVAVAGCQSAPAQRPVAVKANPAADRKHRVDHAYCTSVSLGQAPMPTADIPAYDPGQPTSSQVRVTDQYGNSGLYRVQTTPTYSEAQSFNSGFRIGQAIRARIDARRAQNAIYDGCMAQRGW